VCHLADPPSPLEAVGGGQLEQGPPANFLKPKTTC